MDEKNGMDIQASDSALEALINEGVLEVKANDKIISIEDNPKYKKIELSSAQKARMTDLVNKMPVLLSSGEKAALAGAFAGSDLYVMTLPKGMRNMVMRFKDGSGYGNTLSFPNGRFAMQSPLQRVDISKQLVSQAIVSTAFAAMAVATSQYYLNEINNRLDRMSLAVDKILEFLYGDKKAELMAEVTFTKYAMNNFSAIMEQECQRIATISSLHQARIVAMKDVDFYISDLEAIINSNDWMPDRVKKAIQIEDSLSLALQLCVMSIILEINYSQNFNKEYLKYIEDDMSLYIDKCEKTIIGLFNKLQAFIPNGKRYDKDALHSEVDKVLEKYGGGESELTKSLRSGVRTSNEPAVYYLSPNGDIYIKTA